MQRQFDSASSPESMLLETISQNATAGVKLCECTDSCQMLYANEGLAELTGYSRDQLVGSSYELFIDPEEKDGIIREIKAQNKASGHFRVTYQLNKKNGTRIWVLDSGIIKPNRDGTAIIQSIMIDISEQKRIEAALEVSQLQYEAALSYSDVTMFEYNVKTKKILTQSSDFDTYGMPGVLEGGVEDVINSGIIAQRSKDDLRNLYRAIDEGAPSASTVVYANDVDGNERTLQLQMIGMLDENGVASYAIGVRKDITEAVQLHKEKEYSSQLAEEHDFVFEANVTQNKITYYNPSWMQGLGIAHPTAFSEVVRYVCDTYVAPEDKAIFTERQTQDYLLDSLRNGKPLVTFEYRKHDKGDDKVVHWFESKINIVQDELTNDINIRIYALNIDKRMKEELRAETEQKRHELMLSKSAFTYEIDLTKDVVTFGQKNLDKELGPLPPDNYSRQALPAALAKTHPEDQAAMAAFLSFDNLKRDYASGTTNLEHDYRYLQPSGIYLWHKISLQLFRDTRTHDLMCFTSIENINTQKEADLALLYQAQHDLMTGFFNKNVTKEKINAVLSTKATAHQRHIFFIVDLDYFKLINDHFGHAFGDAVLSQAASKIADLFRAEDILGRIGGDEFVIFMKNVRTEKLAFLKAQELCDTLTETYQQNGTERKLTASVGIAISGRHGTTYDELYRHSDTALYNAKKTGRHRYSLYDDNMQLE
ncbi:MAG: diguanylate cyclase, partial [Raoultibacter sp.]